MVWPAMMGEVMLLHGVPALINYFVGRSEKSSAECGARSPSASAAIYFKGGIDKTAMASLSCHPVLHTRAHEQRNVMADYASRCRNLRRARQYLHFTMRPSSADTKLLEAAMPPSRHQRHSAR